MGYKFDESINDRGKKNHLHTLDGRALKGCTTVCGIIYKVLTWWASGEAMKKFGWLDPKKNTPEAVKEAIEIGYKKVQELSLPEYKKFVSEAYGAHSEKLEDTADVGTKRHEDLETYVKKCLKTNGGIPVDHGPDDDDSIKWFADWSKKNVKKFLWSEIHGYSREMWTGMIADVGWIDTQDRIIAGDFKSAPVAYFNNFVQIAGCDLMLAENGGLTADGEKIFELPGQVQGYCTIPFGKNVPVPEFVYNVNEYKDGFRLANGLYDLNQNFKTIK